ncbi:MAG: hypothetical protein ACYC5J_06880 [Chloroflexota bacterium]
MLKLGSAGAIGETGREESCPHLGLEGDLSSFCWEPSPRHRCYLSMQRIRIDLTHQASFCLTDSHTVCPWLSIDAPLNARLDSVILPLWHAARSMIARSSRRAAGIAGAFWLWLGTVAARLGYLAVDLAVASWRRLRPAMSRELRFLELRGQQGLVGLGHFALRLGALARDLAVGAGARTRKRSGHPPPPAASAEPAPSAEPAGTPDPPESPSPGRQPVQRATLIWQCDACETINTGPLQVCRSCGRPSPPVEELLMSSGDKLLAEALAGLQAGDEELAYYYFVKACKASPNNELAWHWRAKTAPTLDEVILCLERLLKINPGNAKTQADLKWALQRRERERARPEQARPAPQTRRPAAEARPWRTAVRLRRITGELRWWLLQIAGLCAFALALALTIPYVLLAGPPDRPELGKYLSLLPAVGQPELTVQPPYLPAFDVGPALPFLLGLLLLHAAFSVASGGGLGMRVWTALLAAAAGGLMLFFGTNPPAPWYAAGLAALAVAGALAGGVLAETTDVARRGAPRGDAEAGPRVR